MSRDGDSGGGVGAAIALLRAGKSDEAARLGRAIVARQPDNAEALHLLGVVALDGGDAAAAADWTAKAIAADGGQPLYHFTLGEARRHQGRRDAAAQCYRRSLTLMPGNPIVLNHLGTMAMEDGRNAEAEDFYRQAVAARPDFALAQFNLGILYANLGRLAEAEERLRRTLALDPGHDEAMVNLGNVLRAAGRYEAAAECFRAVLARRPDFAEVHSNLGIVLQEQGRYDAALQCQRQAVALKPDLEMARYNLALTLRDLDRGDEAAAALEAIIAAHPDHAAAHQALGDIHRRAGRAARAIICYRRVLAIDPGRMEAKYELCRLYNRMVPSWHFAMLADAARNAAYDRVIRKAVAGRGQVLDIGAGSGLLAMMAARAGAPRVTTCESVAPLAEVAAEIIAANGLADRISVVARKSTRLEIGRDMPARADLLISEVVDVGLIGEGIIATIRHARANLITDDATIIPAAATVFATAIDCPALWRRHRMGAVSGFDLSAFDAFRTVGYRQMRLREIDHVPLAEPTEVFAFDFTGPPIAPEARDPGLVATRDGECHAVAFWFRLQLDDQTSLSSGPENDANHWQQAVQFLDRAVAVAAGAAIPLIARHDTTRIWFDIDDQRAR